MGRHGIAKNSIGRRIYAAVRCMLPLMFVMTSAPFAARADETVVPLEVFDGPKPIETRLPPYPDSERHYGYEGWAVVNFMIDPTGQPYEAVVIDSSGNKALEESARRGVEKWRFEPAKLDGKPVHAGQTYKITFTLGKDAAGATAQFVRIYRRLAKALDAGDRAAADTEFAKIKVTNLYEGAYSNIAWYRYHLKWGSEVDSLRALRAAIAGEATARYLPKNLFVAALENLLPLELRAQDYASALKTWERLKASGVDQKALAKWTPVFADVETMRTDERSYSVPGEMRDGTSWFYELFRKRFAIVVLNGHLSELKLRCDKSFVFFRYEAQVQYNIAERVGECELEAVGEPGTKFELTQS